MLDLFRQATTNGRRPGVCRRARSVGFALLMVALSTPAFAVLGGNVASVQADSVRMRGAVTAITQADTYTVHEIRMGTGTLVREYVASTGSVFAVTWRGPFLPDLRQLLGPYFEQYAQAVKTARARGTGHHPLLIEERGLVVYLGGRPRAFSGKAYLAELMPSGVRADAIK